MEKFAKDKNYFSHIQFDFKNETGCIFEAINHFVAKGRKVFACFLDFRKAFDTVWIDSLSFKLLSEFKVQGEILFIVKTLYSKIQCFIYFNGSTSDKFDVLQGTGQGRIGGLYVQIYVQSLCK